MRSVYSSFKGSSLDLTSDEDLSTLGLHTPLEEWKLGNNSWGIWECKCWSFAKRTYTIVSNYQDGLLGLSVRESQPQSFLLRQFFGYEGNYEHTERRCSRGRQSVMIFWMGYEILYLFWLRTLYLQYFFR